MTFEEIIAKLPKPYYRDEQADIAIYCGDCLTQDGRIRWILTPWGKEHIDDIVKVRNKE